eukprot:TRINITY_DN781_c0_g1_i2.p1 TRINITY_DN781_c0_g1~~TRINITY_DN781_c0_g1_i2.p1  ORF type:complete len:284 (-),score=92.88 TRINITY_DN781_c0_g1_i2:71-922(-)
MKTQKNLSRILTVLILVLITNEKISGLSTEENRQTKDIQVKAKKKKSRKKKKNLEKAGKQKQTSLPSAEVSTTVGPPPIPVKNTVTYKPNEASTEKTEAANDPKAKHIASLEKHISDQKFTKPSTGPPPIPGKPKNVSTDPPLLPSKKQEMSSGAPPPPLPAKKQEISSVGAPPPLPAKKQEISQKQADFPPEEEDFFVPGASNFPNAPPSDEDFFSQPLYSSDFNTITEQKKEETLPLPDDDFFKPIQVDESTDSTNTPEVTPVDSFPPPDEDFFSTPLYDE